MAVLEVLYRQPLSTPISTVSFPRSSVANSAATSRRFAALFAQKPCYAARVPCSVLQTRPQNRRRPSVHCLNSQGQPNDCTEEDEYHASNLDDAERSKNLSICKALEGFFAKALAISATFLVFSEPALAATGRRHHRKRTEWQEVLQPPEKELQRKVKGRVTVVVEPANADYTKERQFSNPFQKVISSARIKAKRALRQHQVETYYTTPDGSIGYRRGYDFQALATPIAKCVFIGCLLLFIFKLFISAAKKYRWGWSEWYEPSKNRRKTYVRDRSLGGKVVPVGDQRGWTRSTQRQQYRKVEPRKWNPLAEELVRSEKELRETQVGGSFVGGRSREVLPGWWPGSADAAATAGMSRSVRDEGQEEAQAMLQRMLNKRIEGRDFESADIIELHQKCRQFGAVVRFEDSTTRETLYRVATNYALTAIGSGGEGPRVLTSADSAAQFAAQFAGDIGVERARAATVVNAAVAAKTRAALLQAWALVKQGRQGEAQRELQTILNIHKAFPAEPNSAEMEMVASGLVPRIPHQDRKALLDSYKSLEGSKGTLRIAQEALGLWGSW